MPSRALSIEPLPWPEPSLAQKTNGCATASERIEIAVSAQSLRGKIPRAEKRLGAERRKTKRRQRSVPKPANKLWAENGRPSFSMVSDGHHDLCRYVAGVRAMLWLAGLLGDEYAVAVFSIGDGLFVLPERKRPREIQRLASLIGRDANRDGLPALWVIVYGNAPDPEGGKRGLHAHIVAVVKQSRVQSYRKSSVFAPYISGKPSAAIKPATPLGLEYLEHHFSEEPAFAGDRTRLSDDLRDLVVASGSLQPYTAKKITFEPVVGVAEVAEPPVAAPLPTPPWRFADDGQGELFNDLPPGRFAGPELRVVRTELGLKQAALAAELGIGQPHVSNVERGHDNLSASTTCRVISLAQERLGRDRLDAILKGRRAA